MTTPKWPEKRQVRYENTKRQMGLDGKIIEIENHIIYDMEDEAYNKAINICTVAHNAIVASKDKEISELKAKIAGLEERILERILENMSALKIKKMAIFDFIHILLSTYYHRESYCNKWEDWGNNRQRITAVEKRVEEGKDKISIAIHNLFEQAVKDGK